VSRASAGKRERERARKEKAEAKATRRLERSVTTPEPDPLPSVDEEELLAELAELHTRFEDGNLDYEDFAAARDGLTRRLRVH